MLWPRKPTVATVSKASRVSTLKIVSKSSKSLLSTTVFTLLCWTNTMRNLLLPTKGKILKRADAIVCSWCYSGVDPSPRFICEKCHKSFKTLLCSLRWQRHRTSLLSQPEWAQCCHCSPTTVASQVIDHIAPWSLFPSLFWDETNHQGLCHYHHNLKGTTDGSQGSSDNPRFAPRR